jgi:hypothetical protein
MYIAYLELLIVVVKCSHDTCAKESTAVFIMHRRELGERTGIQEEGRPCKDEDATRSMVRKGSRSMEDAWADVVERRNKVI